MDEAVRAPRIALIDVIRGGALVAMMVFHGAWDVSFLRLLRFDPGASIGWTIFARAIAATFLLVSGVGLVLARRGGFRRRAYLRRLARIVAAAALVSVATYFVLPQGWIFFGILHQIALATVLSLPFLRLPWPTTAAAAAFFLLLPHFFRNEIFSISALWWVGLAPAPPESFDYVPLFPWFGIVLAGVALARLAVARGLDVRLAAWKPRFAIGRLLDWAGRHSLAVYLIHQPLLYGLFFAVAHLFFPGAPEAAARADCNDRCVMLGDPPEACHAYCGCVFDALETAGLMTPLLDNSLSGEETDRLKAMAGVCSARTMPPAPAQPTETPETSP